MTDQEKVEYWVDLAEYDLETAKALLDSKRYLYVGFMCHQVAEKMLKALYALLIQEVPPKTHNLIRLAELTGILSEMPLAEKQMLTELLPLNIETRYPAYKKELLKELNPARCKELLLLTEQLSNWIRLQLSNGPNNTPV